VVHAHEIGLARATDTELLDVARREERVLITADLDYPRLLALHQASRPGIHARGADLKTVEGLLGHSTPTMTMHYIPADIHAMRAAVKRWGRAASRATAGVGRRKPRRETEPPRD
jgi:predicted nuclease of predicted toxin-antitoxin system